MAEKKYWHPHNAEILSGQLVAPGIPAVAEEALMKGKMNSYGKTWHVWNTGSMGQGGDTLPLGPPMLAWSFQQGRRSQTGTGGAARPADGYRLGRKAPPAR